MLVVGRMDGWLVSRVCESYAIGWDPTRVRVCLTGELHKPGSVTVEAIMFTACQGNVRVVFESRIVNGLSSFARSTDVEIQTGVTLMCIYQIVQHAQMRTREQHTSCFTHNHAHVIPEPCSDTC